MLGGDFVPGIQGNPEEIRCERLSKGHCDHRAGLWKQRRNRGTSSSEGLPHLSLWKLLGAVIQDLHCEPERWAPDRGRLPLPCSAPGLGHLPAFPSECLWDEIALILLLTSESPVRAHSCHPVMSDSLILWTIARQAPLSMGSPRQEYSSGLPCPPAVDLPDPGIELASPLSPAPAGGFFTSTPPGKPSESLR